MIQLFSRRADPSGFSDDELRFAAQAVRDSMLSSLEKDLEPRHTFSEAFLRRMQELFRLDDRRNHRKRILQHAAVFLIGVFLTGALFLAFNPDARADFSRWIRNTYEKSIFYQFFSDGTQEESESAVSLPDVEFAWLPGDYDIQVVFSSPQRRRIFLVGNDDYFVFEYWNVDNTDYVEVFSDDYESEFVQINDIPADFYKATDINTDNVLLWANDDGSIMFCLFSRQAKEVMINLASSIFFKK